MVADVEVDGGADGVIHFVAIAGSRRSVAHQAPSLTAAIRATRFFTGEEVAWTDPLGQCAMAAVTAPDTTATTRLATRSDAFVAINGPARVQRGDQRSLVDQALRAFEAGGPDEVAEGLTGTYNFIGYTPRHGLHAFGDYSGIYPLYWRQDADLFVVSNRSTTVAHLFGPPEWDVHALAWMISRETMLGDEMPARGVRHLSPWERARVAPDGRVTLERSSTWCWPEPGADRTRDDLTSGEWDELTDRLVAQTRALAGFADHLTLFLTGGKDSRLCLALAKAAGLQGHLDTLTTGNPAGGEVICARTVAETAGFKHRCLHQPLLGGDQPAERQAAIAPTDSALAHAWKRLAEHAYRYEGIVSPWDGTVDAGNLALSIKGFGSSYYRRSHLHWFRHHDAPTVAATAERLLRTNDSLRILRRREARRQRDWLRRWVEDQARQVRADLVPEKYFTDGWLCHWNGPIAQARPLHVKLNPLFNHQATMWYFELSVATRQRERLHYEVMRRCAPELVSLPFFNDAWSDAPAVVGADAVATPPPSYSTTPIPAPAHTTTAEAPGSWQWAFLAAAGPAIEQLFEDATKTEMAAICDMRRLRRIARQAHEIDRYAHARELFGAIGVALVLLGRAEPVLDTPPVHT